MHKRLPSVTLKTALHICGFMCGVAFGSSKLQFQYSTYQKSVTSPRSVVFWKKKEKKRTNGTTSLLRQKRDPTWDTYGVANWSRLPTTVGFLEIWDLECWPRWVPGTSGRLVPSQGQRPGYMWSKMANQMHCFTGRASWRTVFPGQCLWT